MPLLDDRRPSPKDRRPNEDIAVAETNGVVKIIKTLHQCVFACKTEHSKLKVGRSSDCGQGQVCSKNTASSQLKK